MKIWRHHIHHHICKFHLQNLKAEKHIEGTIHEIWFETSYHWSLLGEETGQTANSRSTGMTKTQSKPCRSPQ
jgi:hypothetical protein